MLLTGSLAAAQNVQCIFPEYNTHHIVCSLPFSNEYIKNTELSGFALDWCKGHPYHVVDDALKNRLKMQCHLFGFKNRRCMYLLKAYVKQTMKRILDVLDTVSLPPDDEERVKKLLCNEKKGVIVFVWRRSCQVLPKDWLSCPAFD